MTSGVFLTVLHPRFQFDEQKNKPLLIVFRAEGEFAEIFRTGQEALVGTIDAEGKLFPLLKSDQPLENNLAKLEDQTLNSDVSKLRLTQERLITCLKNLEQCQNRGVKTDQEVKELANKLRSRHSELSDALRSGH